MVTSKLVSNPQTLSSWLESRRMSLLSKYITKGPFLIFYTFVILQTPLWKKHPNFKTRTPLGSVTAFFSAFQREYPVYFYHCTHHTSSVIQPFAFYQSISIGYELLGDRSWGLMTTNDSELSMWQTCYNFILTLSLSAHKNLIIPTLWGNW
jgi:hypothetical protein